jgi:hypothetical protein
VFDGLLEAVALGGDGAHEKTQFVVDRLARVDKLRPLLLVLVLKETEVLGYGLVGQRVRGVSF